MPEQYVSNKMDSELPLYLTIQGKPNSSTLNAYLKGNAALGNIL